MAKSGHRFPLVIYTHMMNRWWPAIFTLGLAWLGLAWDLRAWGFEEWRWYTSGLFGIMNIFLGLFLFTIRKSAYVQPFNDHIRVVTPFLRMNISYKRVRRALSANMGALFPPKSISNWRAEIMEPLAGKTAVILDLNALPIPQTTLKFFLSPFFFKDKTPHIILLVDDWMRLSSELESMRSGSSGSSSVQQKRDFSILSKLPHNK